MAAEYHIIVVDPRGRQMEYPLRGELLIGRSPQNHIILDDPNLAPQHLSIGSDGKSCWFRAGDQAGNINVNGDFSREGWLHGGEQITLGAYRLSLKVPEIDAPPDLGDFSFDMPEHTDDLADAAAFLDQPSDAAPSDVPKQQRSGNVLWLGYAIAMYVLASVVLAFGSITLSQRMFGKPDILEQREDAMIRAMNQMLKGRTLLIQQNWQAASIALREAESLTPEGSPLLKVMATHLTRANNEWESLSAYRRAKDLYFKENKGAAALGLLNKIPNDRHIYNDARKLYQDIYDKNIKQLLANARAGLDAKDADKARNNIAEALRYDGDLAEAIPLQQELEKLETATPEGRARLAAERAKFQKGIGLFRGGNSNAALAFFENLSKTSTGLTRRKALRYINSIKNFKTILAQGQQALSSGSNAQAITLLTKARQMDESLGGGNRDKYMGRLGIAYYKRGKSSFASKKYADAYRDYQRSLTFSSNAAAKAGLASVRAQAASLIKQAKLLKDVDDAEARRLLGQVMQILPSSEPLHSTARSLRR
ncbi:hypothetical protein L6R29_17455 [Myxococcota bacterium]|nr:hypothetical protein [Myxococcota bacterium]